LLAAWLVVPAGSALALRRPARENPKLHNEQTTRRASFAPEAVRLIIRAPTSWIALYVSASWSNVASWSKRGPEY